MDHTQLIRNYADALRADIENIRTNTSVSDTAKKTMIRGHLRKAETFAKMVESAFEFVSDQAKASKQPKQ